MKIHLLSIAVLIVSCQQQEQQVSMIPQVTIVSGRIDNYQQQAIQLISDEFLGQKRYEAVWDKEGNFTFSFPMWHTHDVFLKLDNEFILLLLHPGDSIYFTADANRLIPSLNFSGGAGEANTCLSAFMLNFGDLLHSENVFVQMQKASPSEFKAFMASFHSKGDSLASMTKKAFQADKEITNWMYNYVAYRCIEFLYKYGESHVLTQQADDHYFNFIFEYPINETDALQCSQYYQDVLREHLQYQTRSEPSYQKLTSIVQEEQYGKFLTSFIENIKAEGISVSEEIQLTQAFNFVLEKDYQVVDSLWDEYDNVVGLPVLKEQLSFALQEAKYKVEHKMTLQQLAENEKIAPVFREIQTKHEGKVLYIDCWTTWCGPCIKEFPNSVVLHDQLKEEEIEFIYLCLGSNKSQWQNLIDKYKLKGSHFYLDEVQQVALESILRISGVPRYLMIDKEGIVVKENADRPSSANTKDELLTLLRK